MKDIKQKKGFTLAEVLITLGIVGIVALLTLPSVTLYYKHKVLETQFKKQYSSLSQAILQMYKDKGIELVPENFQNTYDFSIYLKDYYHILQDCGNVNVNTKGCISLAPTEENIYNMDLYKSFTGEAINFGYIDDGVLILNDGTVLLFEQGVQAKAFGYFLIGVDVNGFKKKPNRFGHDVFVFRVGVSGNLIPLGANGTALGMCSENSSSSINGYGCALRALNEKDYFKNLPK